MSKLDAITLSQEAQKTIESFAAESGGTHLVAVCSKVRSRFVSAFLSYEIGDDFCADLDEWFETDIKKVDPKIQARVRDVFKKVKEDLASLFAKSDLPKAPKLKAAEIKTVPLKPTTVVKRPAKIKASKQPSPVVVKFEDMPSGWGDEQALLRALSLPSLESLNKFLPPQDLTEFTGPHHSGKGLMYNLGKIYDIYMARTQNQ